MTQYVYYFRSYNDEILYVGKTSDIKRRIREHFTQGHLPPECYQNTQEIYYAKTGNSKYDNEVIETLLINQMKPVYNTEKVFVENKDKATYKLPELQWKRIYVEQSSEELVSLKPFPYPFFREDFTTKMRIHSLIDYNIDLMRYRRGLILKLFPDLIKNIDSDIYDEIIEMFKSMKCGLRIAEDSYDLDQPIRDSDICYNFVSTYIENKSFVFQYFCTKGIFEPTDIDNVYMIHPICNL